MATNFGSLTSADEGISYADKLSTTIMKTTVIIFFNFLLPLSCEGKGIQCNVNHGDGVLQQTRRKGKYQIGLGVNDTTWGLAVGSYVANVQGWSNRVRAIRQSVDESANRDAVEAMGYFEDTQCKEYFQYLRNNYADWFKDQNTC